MTLSYFRVHDKAYNRWMPHINLVYPFMPDTDNGNAFLEAADKIAKAVSYFRPFEIHFTANSFKYFVHRKSCTLWLKPERSASSGTKPKTEECDTEHDVGEMHADVLKLQQIIESQFPGFQVSYDAGINVIYVNTKVEAFYEILQLQITFKPLISVDNQM